jgi:hypothetical protein
MGVHPYWRGIKPELLGILQAYRLMLQEHRPGDLPRAKQQVNIVARLSLREPALLSALDVVFREGGAEAASEFLLTMWELYKNECPQLG